MGKLVAVRNGAIVKAVIPLQGAYRYGQGGSRMQVDSNPSSVGGGLEHNGAQDGLEAKKKVYNHSAFPFFFSPPI